MRPKIIVFVAVLLSAAVFSHGQTRRAKKPARKPLPQEAQTKADPNAITLLYSEDGREYYLHEVVKNPGTDDLSYSYVVVFDRSSPGGRSALTKMMALAKLMVVDMDQMYYVTAVEYVCHSSLKEPSNVQCDNIFWIDLTGNTIAQLEIKPEDSTTLKAQVAEIATYSEPYLQELLDAAEGANDAYRRLFQSRMRLAITTGHESEASKMKFEPRLPKYLPALCLVISGGTKHMSEVLKAAKQVYDKMPHTK